MPPMESPPALKSLEQLRFDNTLIAGLPGDADESPRRREVKAAA